MKNAFETITPQKEKRRSNTVFLSYCLVCGRNFHFASAEQQGNTPSAAKRNQRVDDSADDCRLAAEDPRHDVELEQPDGAPVYGTDDNKDQCKSI